MEAQLAQQLGLKTKKVGIAGKLGFLNLAELLQFIGSNGGTGVLKVKSPYLEDPGFVYFQKGRIIQAKCPPSLDGLDAMYSLFGWIEGTFEFLEEAVTEKKTINRNRMEIILDGLRMLDDGQIPKIGKSFANQMENQNGNRQATGNSDLTYPLITGPNVDYNYVLTEEEFLEGQQIVKENTHGSWVWVILGGKVDILKETPKGQVKILQIGKGIFIGNIDAFSFKESVRSATAVAATNVQLGVMDVQTLTKEYHRQSPEYQNVVRSLDRRLRQMTKFAAAIYLNKNPGKKFVKGKKLFIRQGDSYRADSLYKITRGEAYLIQRTKWGVMPLAKLSQGDFIGQLPFLKNKLNHEPNYASVFASEDLALCVLDEDHLMAQHEQLSQVFKNMVENIAISIVETTRVARIFLKKHLSKKNQ